MREERLDRRLLTNRSGKRRVVVALRQRGGRILTRTFIREAEAIEFVQRRITPGTIVSADEGPHWDLLELSFEMRRITHADAYSRNGAHTNNVESYFSRLRRMIGGQHHRVSAQHLVAYAAHAAWLEDHRDQSNSALADRLIALALATPVSRGWKGYWQRRAA
jgi:ISXO2-like transposase domain